MRNLVKTTALTSLLLMLFILTGFAQESSTSISEEVYNEYQSNGIESAISKYQQLKKEGTFDLDQQHLNLVGYRLMEEDGDMQAAEKIFRLNIEEHPKAANPYDSYGDYLVKIGKTEEAKEYFRKSMAISKNSADDWEKNTLFPNSTGKLAKLENKEKQLDFLVGNWKVDGTGYKDGKESMKFKGKDAIDYNKDSNALFIHHKNDKNESEGMRIIAYDAVDDEFDVAYFNPHSLDGIQVSSMKIKAKGDNSFEFTDSYTTRSGKEVIVKHELKKLSDNELEWVVLENSEGDEWQRIYAMNMTK